MDPEYLEWAGSITPERRDRSLFQAKLLAGALREASTVLIDQLFEDLDGLGNLDRIFRANQSWASVEVSGTSSPISSLISGCGMGAGAAPAVSPMDRCQFPGRSLDSAHNPTRGELQSPSLILCSGRAGRFVFWAQQNGSRP
jgi:hypothetical protein